MCRRIIDDVPTYHVEREIALRLEADGLQPVQHALGMPASVAESHDELLRADG